MVWLGLFTQGEPRSATGVGGAYQNRELALAIHAEIWRTARGLPKNVNNSLALHDASFYRSLAQVDYRHVFVTVDLLIDTILFN